MSRKPDAQTRDAQHRASDPAHSAWVSAHAGSGKTHVLASRVIRLLLEGVPPSRILCLTFTKAAAANMAARVFKTLSEWAVADDADLRHRLDALGAKNHVSFDIARKLFAHAVETPGGLKIQTIHAFCERILHLFPFEANVPADFRVVEETDKAELLAAARKAALAEMAERDDASRAALALVADGTWDGGFVALVNEMLGYRRIIGDTTPAQRSTLLREALGLGSRETEETIREQILTNGIPMSEWDAFADRWAMGSSTDKQKAEKLREAAALPEAAAVFVYLDLFRTTTGGWQKSMAAKGLREADPDLAERLRREMDRLPPLREKWLAARIVARTQALESVCGAVFTHYDRAKQMRALLDFDDLIGCANRLLTHAHASQWVLYKLDGGIDHILVDEAQDTSEPQWQILEALAREFTAGAGRARAHRTFFAVGDEKQSIFSFQGAAPAQFDKMRRAFETHTQAAGQQFAPVPLHVSFRSAADILKAVDTVFSDKRSRRGLSSDPAALSHDALKRDLPGLVELWPPLAAVEQPPPDGWLLPVDATGEHEPPAKLAQKIAIKISRLIDPERREAVEGETSGTKRQVTAGDIMILVRRRDAFFEAMIRALKDQRVPVAGADRLDVVGHIAVMDCSAAGRVALLAEDDLSLATVLKSPLIGLDEDDLIALAPRRSGSLHEALRRSAEPRHRTAAARIAKWQQAALQQTPFDFFSHILGAEGGRRALLSRLGAEANDALDEFLALALAHERTEAPSLVTFLAALESLTLDVKRDLEAAHDAVRVMTVHAAKGLEAKIVFLPDTCGAPSGQFDPAIYAIETPAGCALAWSATKANPAPLIAARDAVRRAQEDEYRRLLYVAMTRAEERLYIAGYYNKQTPKADCWHTMIWNALRPLSESLPDDLEEFDEILRFGKPQSMEASAEHKVAPLPPALPGWLTTPARPEIKAAQPVRPSSALASADRRETDASNTATRARMRGLAIHALLRRLPEILPLLRHTVAKAQLAASWPDLESDYNTIVRDVSAIIDHPDLAPLFSKSSLAEVALAANLPRDGRPPVKIAGQIDRLSETAEAIMIAEYKTGKPGKEGPAPAHVTQLALYRAALRQIRPGKPVRAILIYTDGPQILSMDDKDLERAAELALGVD